MTALLRAPQPRQRTRRPSPAQCCATVTRMAHRTAPAARMGRPAAAARVMAAVWVAAALAGCWGDDAGKPPAAQPAARSAAPASAPVVARATPTPMDNPDLPASLKLDAALNADAPAAVQSLALSAAGADGQALAQWARARWQAADVDALARVLVQLVLGADLQQDAVQHFSAATQAADGSPNYANAAALGYFVGALQSGLDAVARNADDRRALAVRLLRSAAHQAGVAEPTAALPGPGASAGQRWVRLNLYPLLTPPAGASPDDADTLLERAALPLAATRVRANGEPDLEVAVGTAPQIAFRHRLRAVQRAQHG